MEDEDLNYSLEEPVLYGAPLKIREATPKDLPEGVVWIKAKSVSKAFKKMAKLSKDENVSAVIWLPAMDGDYKSIHHYLLNLGRWGMTTTDVSLKDKNIASKKVTKTKDTVGNWAKNFPEVPGIASTDASKAALARWLQQWCQVISDVKKTGYFSMHVYAGRQYNANPEAMHPHVEGKSKWHGFRLFHVWSGDHAFLYDPNQFKKHEGNYGRQRQPKKQILDKGVDAWALPEGAVLFLPDRKNGVIHSAKGHKNASNVPRCLTAIDYYPK